MEFAPMEEMHGLHLARASPIEEERSACGGEARSTSSPASRMENYAEIFGGFAASCSIPVLVLPEAMNGYEEELAGSHNSCLNYLEIFGVLDAGTFSLSYEELFSNEKGSSKKDEEDDRFLDDTDAVQVEAGPPELLVGGHITFSKGNQISSSFHLKFDAAETASPTGFVEVDSPTNAASDDHIRSGYVTEEKVAGKQKETLNRCFVGAIVDGSENDLNNADEPPSTNAAYDLKQRSHSSTHHLTSSADIPLSDYAFFTISNINLCTQPLEVPAPLRAPPKFKMKTLEAPNVTFNRNYQAHHQAGGPHTRNALKETAKSTPIFCDMEVDASKAAAAMVEAMEQAQASLRSAKEFMERIDKQFYDEPFDSDGDIKLEHQIDAHQYFSENDSCGSHGQRSLHGVDDNGDENKALTINAFKINENKMFSGVELQMQDGNAKKSKSGIINDKDEVMSIFGEHQVEETHRHASDMEDISETTVAFDYGEFKSNVGMAHSSKADNRNVTSEFGTYGSYNEENSSFTGLDKTNGPVKKQRAKWNIPNISELNVAELFGQPVCLEKAEEALEFQQKEALEFQQNEEKIVFERPHKFESYEGGLNADGEQKKDEKKILRKVQAALELEKKIMGLSATQQVSAHHVFERERNKEAERKRKLEKERAREREKDAISVASPATAEAGECAIGRVLAEQSSLGATKQTETSCIVSNDKDWQYDEAEGIARAGDEDKDNDSKPCSDVHDTSNDMMSQSEVLEGESPLRCKARQERCQRIVERAAKALAEKNMRDLLAQREQAERNRLAESLDVEIRRWSSGKEGNLRALLSTLQYILGHDSGWQPIPLTEVITAAAVRKAYRKATLYVHPDKLQQRGATIQHKYICEKVFDLLKDAWSKFNSEGR